MRTRRFTCGAVIAATTVSASQAAAAVAFPADQATVWLGVSAAFMLPALVAGLFAVLRGISRALGPVLSTGICVLALLALASYLQPQLLAAFGI
jgi:hypothetical protein